MSNTLYGELLNNSAALLVDINNRHLQDIDAEVIDVYWQELNFSNINVGEKIKFIGQSGTWGSVEPEAGERAIVFLRRYSNRPGKVYECCQHLRVEKIDGYWWAVHFYDITRAKGVPSWLLNAAQPYEKNTPYFISPLDLIERHLRNLTLSHSKLNSRDQKNEG